MCSYIYLYKMFKIVQIIFFAGLITRFLLLIHTLYVFQLYYCFITLYYSRICSTLTSAFDRQEIILFQIYRSIRIFNWWTYWAIAILGSLKFVCCTPYYFSGINSHDVNIPVIPVNVKLVSHTWRVCEQLHTCAIYLLVRGNTFRSVVNLCYGFIYIVFICSDNNEMLDNCCTE